MCPLKVKGSCQECDYSKQGVCDFPYVGDIKAMDLTKKSTVQLPEDRFGDNLQHSDKPEFQALRRMIGKTAMKARQEAENKQFRYELTTKLIREGQWDDGKI